MMVLLILNDIRLDINNEEFYKLGMNIASSKLDYEDILNFIILKKLIFKTPFGTVPFGFFCKIIFN